MTFNPYLSHTLNIISMLGFLWRLSLLRRLIIRSQLVPLFIALITLWLAPVAQAGSIRPGFDAFQLARNDDGSSSAINIGFTVNFFGENFNQLYVNNNGNLTFGESLSEFTPKPLDSARLKIIAPFWADVDTRHPSSGVTKYGMGTVNERAAFGATWIDVGYYDQKVNKLNSFQVILVDRSDVGAGDFDIEFNYDKIQWETGGYSTSGGINGLGGKSAHAGYSNGRDVTKTLPGSGINGAILDGGSNSLVANRSDFSFKARNGENPEQVDERISLEPDGITSVGGNHTVIATLMDNISKIPLSGREITFEVIEGPNAGYTEKVRTNGNGKAFFTYTVSKCAGIDKIQAKFVDLVRNEKVSNIVSRTTVPTAPVARFTITPNPGIIRQTVTLDGSEATAYCKDGRITSHQWQSDDGQAIQPGELSSITYAQTGTYTITLTVTDDRDESHSTSQTITVSEPPPPVASFFATPLSGEVPLTVALDGSSSTAYSGGNITSYQWLSSYGQPTTTGAISSITYTQTGRHEITLTVTDNLGMTNSTPPQSITVFRSNQEALMDVFGSEGFTIEERAISFTTADGKTHSALLSDQIMPGAPSADLFNLTSTPMEDANHDGIKDFLFAYPSGDQQVLYYFGTNLGPTLSALRHYFKQTLGTDAILINQDGSILLTINDVLYEGQLGEVAEEMLVETPKTGFLHLVPYNDVDSDGLDDFVVVYPNGVQQILFHRTLPLSPIIVPPPVKTEISTVADTAEYIYTGENPVQKRVDSTEIEPDKVAILRGNVTNKTGKALFGVIITVDNHPEWGRTNTLLDGTFSLAVNGGELVILNYRKPGYLAARRQVKTEPKGFFWADDVVMTPIVLAQGTFIDLSPANTEPMQVAQGQVVTPTVELNPELNRQPRQPTLFFPHGTIATFSDGTQLEQFEVQITEYTIDDNDLAAMPVPLPAGSGYTYAVNISVDGRTDVRFNLTIPFYLTNFLGFPIGSIVPVGRLDENTDRGWVPAADGRVIKVLNADNGIASLDTNGNGLPDDELGITVAEKQEIAKQFPVEGEFLRIEVNQLGDYDLNWPLRTPPKPAVKHGTITPTDNEVIENPTLCSGCIIDAESYVLKKTLPVTGIPFNLNYRSNRTPGRTENYLFNIPLQDSSVPTPKRIKLEVSIWGQKINQIFSDNPADNPEAALDSPSYTYEWDGKDGYGRDLEGRGRHQATVRIGYVYNGVYEVPSEVTQALIESGVVHCSTEETSTTTPEEPRGSFGCIRATDDLTDEISTGIPARQEVTGWQEYTVNLGAWIPRAFGLGGWTLDIHHTYDPNDKVLYQGDGKQRQVEPLNKADKILIASEDSGLVYEFNQTGTHLRTLDSLTNQTLYTFSYLNGYLVEITDIDGKVITIERDGLNNPLAIIAPYGQRTELRLDANGYLASVTNPLGQVHQMVYKESGLLTQYTDPRGHTTEYGYTDTGFFEENTDPAKGGWALEHDLEGNGYTVTMTSKEDRVSTATVTRLEDGTFQQVNTAPDGTQTIFTQKTTEDNKKLTTTVQADGTKITLLEGHEPERFEMQSPLPELLTVETPAGLVSTLTTELIPEPADETDSLSLTKLTEKVTVNGRTSTRVYDVVKKTITATSAGGRRRVSKIDNGRVILERTPELANVHYKYDDKGRLIKTQVGEDEETEARTTQISYDNNGYVNQITDALGREFKLTHDAAGRVTTQIWPDGREIHYSYDANDNLTEISSPGRPTQTVSYTEVNLPQQKFSEDLQTRYEYNLDKQLTKIVRPDEETVELLYDDDNDCLNTIKFSTGEKSYLYDSNGKISRILLTPDNSTLSYAYDGSLPLSETWGNGNVVAPMKNTYNQDFRVISSRINGLQTVDYSYDADGLLIEAGFLKLVYSAKNGLLMGTQLGSMTTQRTHNRFGEVESQAATHNKDTLYTVEYRYNKGGRITEKVETLEGDDEITYTYRYDDLTGYLVEVTADGVITEYRYDSHGNRLSADTPNGFFEGSYDEQERLIQYGDTTYEYTANGALFRKNSGSVITEYEYDVFGNLRTVKLPAKEIEYLIDGRDRRIGKWVDGEFTQGWLYQGSMNPIAELDASGNLVTRFVYGSKTNVPDYMIKDNLIYRLLSDHLGSPRLVVELDNGTIVQRLDYDVFGNVIQDTNPGFQPFGFAGGLYDADTGLVRFEKRDYDAETGRWTVLEDSFSSDVLDSLCRVDSTHPSESVLKEDSFSSYVRDTPIERFDLSVLPTTSFLHLNKDIFNLLNPHMLKAISQWEERKDEDIEKGVIMTQDDMNEMSEAVNKFNNY